jgi:predicted HTH domain antitoxin
MPEQLIIEVPDNAFSVLRVGPEDFVQEMKMAEIVKWYEMGKISQSKASELAGISRRAFLDVLHRFHVSPFQMTREELEKEIARA